MKSNLEIVQTGYNNFQQGNIQGILDLLNDDITWELPSSAGVPFSGVFSGKKGVLDFFNRSLLTMNSMSSM